MVQIQQNLDMALLQEEEYWLQRSWIDWLAGGDKNTAFFHKKASIRKHKNHISSLQDENGQWTSNTQQLSNLL